MNFDFSVLLQQMLAFYTMIAVGFLGYRTKLFGDAEVSALSALAVRLFVPLMLSTSIVNTVDPSMLGDLPVFLLYLILALGIMMGAGLISGVLMGLLPLTVFVCHVVPCLSVRSAQTRTDGKLRRPCSSDLMRRPEASCTILI